MSKINKAYPFFTQKLLQWNQDDNDRSYPWRNLKDPYKIWLSEILLQQTRSDQGLAYYLKFTEKYKDIHQLAAAPDDEVFLLWQGLGYYNRCKNLLISARYISKELKGIFPDDYEGLLNLKGVGSYTASAIASFAYDLPHAVLDGNVYRVVARYFGVFLPIDTQEGKQKFQQLAQENLAVNDAAQYNQAIMDFGATVCKPKLPLCSICPLAESCLAFKHDYIAELPFKSKKIKVVDRYFHYFLLKFEEEIFLQQRKGKDIWQSLYELYPIEINGDFKETEEWGDLSGFVVLAEENVFQYKQRLTHQLIRTDFHEIQLNSKPEFLSHGTWISRNNLKNYSFPKTILSFLSRMYYF